jgi:hypothetical protein
LSAVKPSTSNTATDTSPPWRPRASSSSSTRESAQVRQPGQRVALGEPLRPFSPARG